jgi:hypothetical protein
MEVLEKSISAIPEKDDYEAADALISLYDNSRLHHLPVWAKEHTKKGTLGERDFEYIYKDLVIGRAQL